MVEIITTSSPYTAIRRIKYKIDKEFYRSKQIVEQSFFKESSWAPVEFYYTISKDLYAFPLKDLKI